MKVGTDIQDALLIAEQQRGEKLLFLVLDTVKEKNYFRLLL